MADSVSTRDASLTDPARLAAVRATGLPEPWASDRQTPLSHSFCQYVVRRRDAFVVDDARRDPLVAGNGAVDDLGVVAYLGVPVTGLDGHVLGSFCVIQDEPRRWSDEDLEVLRDVTSLVQREIDLRASLGTLLAAQEEVDRAVSSIAHDLRTPAHALQQSVELLERHPGVDAERRQQVLGIVRRQGERLLHMAERLLPPGGPPAATAPLDAVVENVAAMRTLGGAAGRLTTDVAADARGHAVPTETATSLVSNLVDNALHHTDGAVRVHLRRDGDALVLVVADDGPGFATDGSVWEPGHRSATSSGYGLGLGIVRERAAELGAHVDVESSPATGSVFTVRLPAQGQP